MKTKYNVGTFDDLLVAIANGVQDPTHTGSPAVEVTIWDRQKVIGEFHNCPNDEVNVFQRTWASSISISELAPFTERLLQGTPFVTRTGTDDMVCILRWRLVR